MVRATWMADRQSPGLLGCIDMMAKSWDASRLKARFPARKKGAGKALMGRRVSAVRAGVREPVAEVW